MPIEKPQSSSNPYVKVANFTGLYRHSKTGAYYAVKKIGGKRKERSLGTADRKIAERRFKEWVDSLGKVDSEVEKTTVRQLVTRFEESNRGFVKNTQVTTGAIIKSFRKWLGSDFDMEVRKIRPSQLDEWLASEEPRLRNTTYNRYAGFLKQLFELAEKDRIIPESPAKLLRTRWKKPQSPVRRIPTLEQFRRIVESSRGRLFWPYHKVQLRCGRAAHFRRQSPGHYYRIHGIRCRRARERAIRCVEPRDAILL